MSLVSIVRRRRERALRNHQRAGHGFRLSGLGCGMLFSLLGGLLILSLALAYANLTHDLPSADLLPTLLNPPDGLLLQPTRLYDRTGQHLLATLSPQDTPRRYIPLSSQNPQHLPQSLVDATVLVSDPGFWREPGYTLDGWNNPDSHPTLAQRLVTDLLLWDEPPTLRRAVRERILAAQITAEFGRTQVLEWYLNSANYGHYAYGVDAAARFYFGKPAAELNLSEAATLAATSQAPALNPLDAPQAAYQRGQETVQVMRALGLISQQQADNPGSVSPMPSRLPPNDLSPAFTNLVLAQLDQVLNRGRIERGGLTITTTLDYDLQIQTACAVQTQLNHSRGDFKDVTAGNGGTCQAARLLPTLPLDQPLNDLSANALVLDPRSGQVLAAVGEIPQGGQAAYLGSHPAGSLLTPFVYLTGFTRGLSPASLSWDIPGLVDVQNPDGTYHGPVRLRIALDNDYLVPAEQVLEQMGAANVWRTVRSFGLDLGPDTDFVSGETPLSPLSLAGAYSVFATGGSMAGHALGEEAFQPVGVLRVEGVDHSSWLDWSTPQTRAVVTPQLAYLLNNVLSDETARWPSLGSPNALEVGRPAGVKLGQTVSGRDTWAVGYTPQRVVAVWMGAAEEGLSPRLVAGMWHALIQYASRDLPPDDWSIPPGVSVMNVCDPSGLLPTSACPIRVNEVFLQGNEPVQADNLFRTYQINRETGYLATVFTPPQLVEDKVYMVVPPEAKSWAESAGLPTPPNAYDAIQSPEALPNAHINTPSMFSDVRGKLEIKGTASADDLDYYRVQVGQGLNPKGWLQVGQDVHQPVQDGELATWDTTGLNGLYAVQLLVVHKNQRVDVATIQVTVDNEAPQLNVLFPQNGQTLEYSLNRQLAVQVQASDNLALAKVEFYVDGKLVTTLMTSPFTAVWDASVGKHSLRVVAYDQAGNQAQQEVEFRIK
jgi:membrane peptidoglycan carboxypeptidase